MTTPAVVATPAAPTQLNPGEVTDTKLGNPAPVDRGNTPPVVAKAEPTAEEKAAAEAKTIADAKAITDAAEAAKATEREGWQKEYVKMENPDAQAAIDIMNKAGVSPVEANAIFAKAIESRDLKDIDWATLEAKTDASTTRLVKNGIEKYFNDVVAVQTKTTSDVHGIMGGEANWVTVRAWAQAQEKTDPAFKAKVDEYRAAIDAGGFSAKAAASALKADYEAHPDNGGLGQASIQRGGTLTAGEQAPLSRADYNTAIKAAEKSNAPEAVKQALHNRRRAGMKAGI